MKKSINILFQLAAIAIVLITSRCANIRPPHGGPKDTLAPKLTYSFPINKQTRVKSNEILLVFDSDINVDNLEKELIVTPVMPKKYKVKSTNRNVKITFNEPLQNNTTYTLTFRKGITDITENNAPKNLSLVFTTGETLDSFYIEGTVKKFMTKTKMPNAVVSFYKTDKDTITENSIPLYQTETNESGLFKLENIKEDNYLIYAFNDANKDYKYNSATESLAKFGFEVGNNDPLELELFPQDKSRIRIAEKEQKGKTIICQLSKGITNASIKSLRDTTKYFYKINGKSLEVIPDIKEDTLSDTLHLEVTMKDSSNFTSRDTLVFKYKYNLTPQNLTINFYEDKINQIDLPKYIIETNTPIQKVLAQDIEIRMDKKKFSLSEFKYYLNENKTKLQIQLPYAPKDSIKIKILPQTITSIYSDTNAVMNKMILYSEQDSKGILGGTIKTIYPNYIVELLQENYAVKESFYNVKQFKIKNLEPGTYMIRLIEDRNNNGRWDFEINGKPNPEKITYFPEKIIMKANWEINDVLISD